MVALYAVSSNFCGIHKSLWVSPAMVAGVTDRLWSMEDVAEIVEAGFPKPGKRGRTEVASSTRGPGQSDFGRLHAGFFRDNTIAELMLRVWRDAEADAPLGALFADAVWLTVDRLLLLKAGVKDRGEGALHNRPDWRIRRTIETLEDRLGEDIGLAELAAGVGLSPRHYAALFRAATGMPPHRWLTQRRLARACEMLHDPRLSVTEIAYACGFASSQHLATVFRHHRSRTPSEYRRERLA